MKYVMRLKGLNPEVDPQRAGARIEQLIERTGGLFTEQDMVNDARRPSSPLHKVFEWQNTVAAEKFRVRQARRFIRDLSVKATGKRKTQAFIYVKHPGHGGRRVIMGVRTVVGTPDLRRQVVERKLEAGVKSLKSWLVNYGGSEEFRSVRRHVERMRQAIERELLSSVVPRQRIRLHTAKPSKAVAA